MRCSFGYTVKSPYVERRVKYYDENGIYDESVQSDDELIVIGEKLRNGGYRTWESRNDHVRDRTKQSAI